MSTLKANNLYDAAGTGAPAVNGLIRTVTSASPGTNQTVAGTDNSVQLLTPSAAIDVTLNSTHKGGRSVIIHNLHATNIITVKANDGTTIRTLHGLSHCEVMPTQDTPTANTHWVGLSIAYSPWIAFTPTSSWIANSTHTGSYRRVGENLEIMYKTALTGAPTAATLNYTIPLSAVIDTTKMLFNGSTATSTNPYSLVHLRCAGVAYTGSVIYSTTTTFDIYFKTISGSNVLTGNATNATAPGTFANADLVFVVLSIPVVGWTATKG